MTLASVAVACVTGSVGGVLVATQVPTDDLWVRLISGGTAASVVAALSVYFVNKLATSAKEMAASNERNAATFTAALKEMFDKVSEREREKDARQEQRENKLIEILKKSNQ